MTRAVVLVFAGLIGCAQPPESAEITWRSDLRAFCEARAQGWLAGAIDRIDRALPEEFEDGSTRFEGLNVQAPFDGRADARELQLRLTASRAAGPVSLSAYAIMAPDDCALREFEVIEGYDRLDPPFRASVNPG